MQPARGMPAETSRSCLFIWAAMPLSSTSTWELSLSSVSPLHSSACASSIAHSWIYMQIHAYTYSIHAYTYKYQEIHSNTYNVHAYTCIYIHARGKCLCWRRVPCELEQGSMWLTWAFSVYLLYVYACICGYMHVYACICMYMHVIACTSVLYVVPLSHILGKLPLVPAGDDGTIPWNMHGRKAACYPRGVCDRQGSPGSGSPLFYINSWAMIWPVDYKKVEKWTIKKPFCQNKVSLCALVDAAFTAVQFWNEQWEMKNKQTFRQNRVSLCALVDGVITAVQFWEALLWCWL